MVNKNHPAFVRGREPLTHTTPAGATAVRRGACTELEEASDSQLQSDRNGPSTPREYSRFHPLDESFVVGILQGAPACGPFE